MSLFGWPAYVYTPPTDWAGLIYVAIRRGEGEEAWRLVRAWNVEDRASCEKWRNMAIQVIEMIELERNSPS